MSPALVHAALVGFIACPFLVLVHELGHAAAALIYRSGPVNVKVGVPALAIKVRSPAVNLEFSPIGAYGICAQSKGLRSRREAIVKALAGPLASLICGLLLLRLGSMASGSLRITLFACGVTSLQMLAALIPSVSATPLTPRPLPSDGMTALRAAQDLPALPPIAEDRGTGLKRQLDRSEATAVLAYGVAFGALLAISPVALGAWLGVVAQSLLARIVYRPPETQATSPS